MLKMAEQTLPSHPRAAIAQTPILDSNTPILDLKKPVATDFPKFTDLALELRRMIWKAAIVPRLVHWRPGGGKAPATLLACKESRAELCAVYVLCFDVQLRKEKYGLFINRDIDTIYCKNKLPNIIKMDYLVLFPVEYPVPEGKLGRDMNMKVWTHDIKNLMVKIDEAVRTPRLPPNIWPPHPVHHQLTIWKELEEMYPNLEILNIALLPQIRKHHGLQDLVDTDIYAVNLIQAGLIASFTAHYQQKLADGKFLRLKVKFVKLSDTASTAPDAPLGTLEGERGVGTAEKRARMKRFNPAYRQAQQAAAAAPTTSAAPGLATTAPAPVQAPASTPTQA